ncbi:MAG: hypothetical protein J1F10_04480 [Muribaculaceae bacterium]|nr:hypothetical protein [Muribaculaceae bacterium]
MNKSSIKHLFVPVCLICNISVIQAQSFDEYKKRVQSEFNQYKSDKEHEFKEYRDRINAEFAEYMRQAWPEYKSKPAEPVPDSPEPPKPVIKDPDTPPSNDPIPFDEVKPAPKPVKPPQPVVPLPKIDNLVPPIPNIPKPVEPARPTKPAKPIFTFTFYGQRCEMPLESIHWFTLKNATENAVADGWIVLSSDRYLPIVAQCLEYRDKLHLPDWGYVRFVEQMTTAFFSASQLNEARLMQMYILTQSGYKVRIARVGNKLVLLLPSKDKIYQYSYLNIGGTNYYLVESSSVQATINVFNREFPKEQDFSLRIAEQPLFAADLTVPRHLQSKHDKELTADVAINKSLIAFYNDYPLSNNWDIYANASLSEPVKKQLYPALRSSIAGKNNPTAANILLHFVQTAFEYATDDEQFGCERPLFADETLYYPYSDCEDRAILFSVLVRELLGLDVVLLHYPGHLATAVCFDTEVSGDYMMIGGKRYIVCDPTYINADIGQAMPQFKQTAATVIKTRQ